MQAVSEERFEQLVEEALDQLPDELFQRLDNVAVVIENANPDHPGLLGLYEGVPLTERWDYSGVLPDRIAVYRLPLCAAVADERQLIDQVRITVLHELAHHVGIDDEALGELGWG